jgi:hypothetical protein
MYARPGQRRTHLSEMWNRLPTTLHKNTNDLEFSKLLPYVVTIADEVDAQLKEQMLRFMAADAAERAKGK